MLVVDGNGGGDDIGGGFFCCKRVCSGNRFIGSTGCGSSDVNDSVVDGDNGGSGNVGVFGSGDGCSGGCSCGCGVVNDVAGGSRDANDS